MKGCLATLLQRRIETVPDPTEDFVHEDWLERYDDHDFSFTDAVSFAAVTERGIAGALTLDRHFAAAGFRIVPA